MRGKHAAACSPQTFGLRLRHFLARSCWRILVTPCPFFFSLTSLCPPFPCTLQPYLDIAGLNRAVLGRLEREKNTVREADSLLQARYLLSGAPQVAEQRDAAQPPDDEPEAPQADAAEAD